MDNQANKAIPLATMRAVMGWDNNVNPEPTVLVTMREGSTDAELQVVLHLVAAEIIFSTPPADQWRLYLERGRRGTGSVRLEIRDTSEAGVARAMEVLRRVCG